MTGDRGRARPDDLGDRDADGAAFAHIERVRFGDLDAMAHMNNVAFLRFFETARIEYLRFVIPETDASTRATFGFVIAECLINYRSPAFYDEDIRTEVRPDEVRRSSIRLAFEMHAEGEDRLVADGYGVLVGYDYEAGRARPLPDEVAARVAAARR